MAGFEVRTLQMEAAAARRPRYSQRRLGAAGADEDLRKAEAEGKEGRKEEIQSSRDHCPYSGSLSLSLSYWSAAFVKCEGNDTPFPSETIFHLWQCRD